MSRHRNVRNMKFDEDYGDDYDDYDYDDEEEEENGEYSYDRNSMSANYYNYITDSGRNSPAIPKTSEAQSPPNHPISPSTSIVRNLTAPVLHKPKVVNSSTPGTPRSQHNTPKKTASKNTIADQTPTRPSSELDLTTFRRNQLQALTKAPSVQRNSQKRIDVKDLINLIVVGHVDAGKSTLMGHLLYDLEYVDNRTMEKYRHESAKSGKSSFAYAWVLDETEEERERGVTMDVARSGFETSTKRVVLLDAPGHKDFISHMITGTSQADAAILVINGTRGEFETGFENGGQTKEHALLLRALGVTQLVVAVNKLDTVEWSADRFEEIKSNLSVFLTKQAGFSKPKFIPVSGLSGENLTKRLESSSPGSWYDGPCLVELIDSFTAPQPPSDGPLRIVIHDVEKTSSSQIVISGKIESGEVLKDDKVYIMPSVSAASVKACANNDGVDRCLAGDNVLITMNGSFEQDAIQAGSVVVHAGPDMLIPVKRFTARIVVFDVKTPIIKGTKAEVYAHSVCVPCTVVRLINTINKANGEILKQKPRFLARGTSASVEIEADSDIAIETFTACRALGRVTFRSCGQTIAAGIVESVVTL